MNIFVCILTSAAALKIIFSLLPNNKLSDDLRGKWYSFPQSLTDIWEQDKKMEQRGPQEYLLIITILEKDCPGFINSTFMINSKSFLSSEIS